MSKMRSVAAPTVDERRTADSEPSDPRPMVTLLARVSPLKKLIVVVSPVGVMVGPRAMTPGALALTIVRLPVTAEAFHGIARSGLSGKAPPTNCAPANLKLRTTPAVKGPLRPMFIQTLAVARVSRMRLGAIAV